MISWRRLATLAAVAGTAFAVMTGSASAATVTVTPSSADETPGVANGSCSIREAIGEAQQNGPQGFSPDCVFDLTQPYGNDTINIPAGTYPLTGASGDNSNLTGDLDVTLSAGNGLTLAGAGATTVIDANDNDRVIHFIGSAGTGALSNLTLTDGTGPAAEGGGGIFVSFGSTVTASGITVSGNTTTNQGGGILNGGTLTISGSSITGNTTATSSGSAGAGITSAGTTTIDSSTVTGNTVTSPDDANNGTGINGGGVVQTNGGTVTVTDSTISGNVINSLDPDKFPHGGGISLVEANLVLRRSTLSGNISGGGGAAGGALDLQDSSADNTAIIENSTFSGNAASSATSIGGAINLSRGITTIANATFTNNTAVFGRAIFYQHQNQNVPNSTVTLHGSLLQENGTDECGVPQGPLTSAGYNIDRGTSCGLNGGTDQQSTTATLGSLANNGGPTQTHAISGAVAVDDIPANQCFDSSGVTLLSTDQRGVERPQGASCDVGAYELATCNGQASTIVGTGAGETIGGTSGADVIVAGGGADTVNGGDGADVICGGDGNDTIRTGTGNDNDTALGEVGTDTISFDDLSAGVTSANLTTGTTSGTDVGVDTLSGFENLTGSPFNDVSGSTGLTGDGAQNTIDGGGGNDTIQGLGDNDTLVGGAGTDTATWIGLGPVNASLAAGTATGGQGTDSLSGFENLTGSPTADTLTGDDNVNTLIGFTGASTFDGRGGADVIQGDNAASDTVTYANQPGPVMVNLATSVVSGAQGADLISLGTVENVTGSPDGDTITGDADANTLTGGLGTDSVFANAGADTLLIRDSVADTADCGSDADLDTVQADQQGTDTLTNCGLDTVDFAVAPPPDGGGGSTTTPPPTSATPAPNPLCATLRAKLKRAKAAHNEPLIRKLRKKLRKLGC